MWEGVGTAGIQDPFLSLCVQVCCCHCCEGTECWAPRINKVKKRRRSFHGSSAVKNAWQCRRHRFDPLFGKIPHAAKQISPCPTTIEAVLQSLKATATEACMPGAYAPQQEEPPQWEACVPNLEWPQLAATREKPLQQPTQNGQKWISK